MKVGDKRQAIVLSVVALGALGFLASQFIGATKASSPVQSLLVAITGQGAPEHPTPATYPQIVTRDAFSHPKLEMTSLTKDSVKPVMKDAPPNESRPANAAPERVTGALPSDPGWLKTVPEDAKGPEENTGKAEKENEASGISIRLLATLRASSWRAILQVGSEDPVEVSPGQVVAKGVLITKIGDEGVTIAHANRKVTILVGEGAQL